MKEQWFIMLDSGSRGHATFEGCIFGKGISGL